MAVYGSSTYGVGIYGGSVGVDPASLRINQSTAAPDPAVSTAAPDATHTTAAIESAFTTEVRGT